MDFPTDHFILDFRLSCCLRRFNTHRRFIYNFKNTDFDALPKDILESTVLNDVVTDNGIDTAWSDWSSALMDIIRKHAPKTHVRDVSSPPWFDSEVRHLQKQKETSRRRAVRTNLPSHKAKFLDLGCKCKNLIARKHRECVKELARTLNSNPKRFWSYFRANSKTNSVPDSVSFNNRQFTTPSDKAEAFN